MKICASAIVGFPSYAAEQGLNYGDLLYFAAVPREAFAEPKGQISLRDFTQLLEVGARMSGDELFALRFALGQEVKAAGPLTYAMRNAATVKNALLILVEFVRTRLDVAHIELIVEGSRARLEWTLPPMLFRRAQLVDYCAAGFARKIAHIICSDAWRPQLSYLDRPRPPCSQLHHKIFNTVEFDQAVNALSFDAGTLGLPVVDADPHLHRVAMELLHRLAQERCGDIDLMTQLREEIFWMLGSEDGPQIDRVARRMGMSTRSLQRQLANEGTTFLKALSETRRAAAQHYLEESDLSMSQIAYRLSFSGPSAFTRAVYRWFGVKPSDMRPFGRTANPRSTG